MSIRNSGWRMRGHHNWEHVFVIFFLNLVLFVINISRFFPLHFINNNKVGSNKQQTMNEETTKKESVAYFVVVVVVFKQNITMSMRNFWFQETTNSGRCRNGSGNATKATKNNVLKN